MDEVLAFVFLFGDLNEMESVRGDYFIKIFKGKDGLSKVVKFVSFHVSMENGVKEFMVSILAPVICGKRQEYLIEVDDEVSFQYIFRFARRGDVEKLRPGGLLREDVSG